MLARSPAFAAGDSDATYASAEGDWAYELTARAAKDVRRERRIVASRRSGKRVTRGEGGDRIRAVWIYNRIQRYWKRIHGLRFATCSLANRTRDDMAEQ